MVRQLRTSTESQRVTVCHVYIYHPKTKTFGWFKYILVSWMETRLIDGPKLQLVLLHLSGCWTDWTVRHSKNSPKKLFCETIKGKLRYRQAKTKARKSLLSEASVKKSSITIWVQFSSAAFFNVYKSKHWKNSFSASSISHSVKTVRGLVVFIKRHLSNWVRRFSPGGQSENQSKLTSLSLQVPLWACESHNRNEAMWLRSNSTSLFWGKSNVTWTTLKVKRAHQ